MLLRKSNVFSVKLMSCLSRRFCWSLFLPVVKPIKWWLSRRCILHTAFLQTLVFEEYCKTTTEDKQNIIILKRKDPSPVYSTFDWNHSKNKSTWLEINPQNQLSCQVWNWFDENYKDIAPQNRGILQTFVWLGASWCPHHRHICKTLQLCGAIY